MHKNPQALGPARDRPGKGKDGVQESLELGKRNRKFCRFSTSWIQATPVDYQYQWCPFRKFRRGQT